MRDIGAAVRRVSSASRTAMAGPPRLTMALVSPSGDDLAAQAVLLDVAGEALAQQRAGNSR